MESHSLLDQSSDYPNIQNNDIPGLQLINQATPAGGKVISGNTSAGLPFLVVIRSTGNTVKATEFVSTHVLPLIDACAIELAETQLKRQRAYYSLQYTVTEQDVIKRLIRKIHQIRIDKKIPAEDVQFQMSLAITYQVNNPATEKRELYCAGFGIGETMIVFLRKADGSIETLADNVSVKHRDHDRPLDNDFTFTDFTQKTNLDLVIERNTVFNHAVAENDVLYGLAYSDGIDRVKSSGDHGPSALGITVTRKCADTQLFRKAALAPERYNGFDPSCRVDIPHTFTQNKIAKELYSTEKARFKQMIIDKNTSPAIKSILDDILANAEKAERIAEPDYPKLTRSLTAAYNVMVNPTDETFTRLREQANAVDNTSHKVHKALAIGLLALGVAMIVIGLALMCTGVGIFPGALMQGLSMIPLMTGIGYMTLAFPQRDQFGKTGLLSTSKFGKFGMSRKLHTLADQKSKLIPAH